MNKKNLILGGILLFLVGLAYLFQGPFKDFEKKKEEPKNFLASLKFDDVEKIEIVKGNTKSNIERKDDKWIVSGTKSFFVKDDLINKIKTSLEEVNKADLELISKNSAKKSEFEVDSDKGLQIKMTKGENVLAYFLLGKMTGDFQGTYLAEPDKDETYIIKANLKNAFDRDDWYDKTIFATDQEKINKVRFQYKDEGFTVQKNEQGKWEGLVPFKFPVSDEKIKKIVEIMANLSAIEIPKQTFEGTGLEKNSIIVQATGENGSIDNTIMIGNADKNGNFYAKSATSDNIYLISKENKESLKIKASQLK